MSKVLLIKPYHHLNPRHFPLGLVHVGTALKQAGHEVTVVDVALDREYETIIRTQVRDDVLWVGVGCLTTDVKSTLQICSLVKELSPTTPVVWGGTHATLFPEQVASHPLVDFAVFGEGEYPAVNLTRALERQLALEDVPGICYKRVGQIVKNPPERFVDLESLPEICYDLVDVERYLPRDRNRRALPYQSSRGCPHRCVFCINPMTGNRRFRCKSAHKLLVETRSLVERYDLGAIHFVDDNFFVNRKRVKDFVALKREMGLEYRFNLECRADYFRDNFVDRQLIADLVDQGLFVIQIGAESGSERILALLEKGITVDQVLHSVEVLKDFEQLEASYGFMVGVPGETPEDLWQTVDLFKTVIRTKKGNVSAAMVTFTPYPKCPLTDQLIQSGVFREPQTLDEWTEPDIVRLYTDRFGSKPWHTNPSLLRNLSNYSLYGYNYYNEETLRSFFRSPRMVLEKWPLLGIVLLSKARFHLSFYHFPIDLYGYRAISKAWPALLKRMRSFVRLLRRAIRLIRRTALKFMEQSR